MASKPLRVYQIYRKTHLGEALQESLEELAVTQQLPESLITKTLAQFDQSMTDIMEKHVTNKISFKGKCKSYRQVDNVWSVQLLNVDFKIGNGEVVHADKCHMVAMDGKAT